jgi:hypothetical protein
MTGLYNRRSGLHGVTRSALVELILICTDLRIHIHFEK